jgi:hypothetical protein
MGALESGFASLFICRAKTHRSDHKVGPVIKSFIFVKSRFAIVPPPRKTVSPPKGA